MSFESASAAVQMLMTASGTGSEAAPGGLPTLNFGKVGFYLLLLVGCGLFAALMGLVSSWIDRKVTALVQARVGPRPTQPLWDLLKLLGKETVIPEGANRLTFALMPLVALASVALAATILLLNVLWQNGLLPSYFGLSYYGVVGDLIVVLYLLAVPSLALVIGASSSNNPFASVGASREMKLMSYELPLLLAVATALVLASATERRFTNELQRQVDAQTASASPLHSSPLRDAPKPVESVVPLRLDQLLALRDAGPKAGGRLRLDLAEGRLRAQLAAWRSAVRADRQEIVAKLTTMRRNLAQLKTRLAEQPKPAALANVSGAVQGLRDEIRRTEDGIDAAENRRSALDDRDALLALEESRLKLAWLEREAKPQAPRHDQELKRRREALKADVGKLVQRGLVSPPATPDPRPELDGALFLNDRGLSKAAADESLGRLLALCALALCVAVAVMCAQAKLGLVPFDCAEAETEIAGGVFIEYGGPLLAAWKLSRQMLLFVMPVFIGIVFLGGFRFFVPEGSAGETFWQAFWSVVKYVAVLVVFILVRNTNPRVRIDQAMRFFLGPMTVLAVLALAIAVFVFHVLA